MGPTGLSAYHVKTGDTGVSLKLRESLLQGLEQWLQQQPEVNAVWLEGADARNAVDQWSDIDCCISLCQPKLTDFAAKFQTALMSICPAEQLEYQSQDHRVHLVYEITGTTPPLLLDIDLLFKTGDTFYPDDPIELPRVLFEKSPQLTFNRSELTDHEIDSLLTQLDGQIQQASRVRKYLQRNSHIEAFAYYEKFVLKPLITLLRLRHTPRHPDYYIVHISDHLPVAEKTALEALYYLSGPEQLQQKLDEALDWYQQLRSSS